jgi:nucleotide-binding universal stress UspA family protein
MATFQTVVVATDFSETAEDALSAALEIVRDTTGRLLLLNVVPDPLHQPWMVGVAGIDFGELQRSWVNGAKERFQALTTRRRLDATQVTTAVVVGRPATEIVRFLQEAGADLLVMGTHGYGGVKRLLLGSVADQVVRQATCPVLVVPHKELRAAGDAATLEAQVSR